MRFWSFALLLLAACAGPVSPNRSIVRLEKKPDEPFASFVRSVDASSYRGRTVVVSGRLESIGIAKGANGLWLRSDGFDRKPLGFASSYGRSLIGNSGWVERSAMLDIGEHAERIVFGAMNSSSGTLLLDDLRLQPIEEFHAIAPSPTASEYLEDALEKIHRLAYYSDRVDWTRARLAVRVAASGAQTTTETYDAIRYVLTLLGDHHSHLFDASYARDAMTSTARDFNITGAMLAEIGYVAVPGYNGQNAERSEAFSSAIRAHIADAQRVHVCRWIVDLRNDGGGNMYPMLQGLAPLLGGQPLGFFHNRGGEWISWSARYSGVTKDASHDAVAVITGHKTASAGEAVTLSFRGRPHARSFGQPTAGYSTANQPVRLSDGAVIALTTGLMADRERHLASGSIPPDEPTEAPDTVDLDHDPAIRAAADWLERQPCTG